MRTLNVVGVLAAGLAMGAWCGVAAGGPVNVPPKRDVGAAGGAGQAGGEPGSVVPRASERFRKHGVASAPAKEAGRLRLATYNVHELYDDADDPALTGRSDDAERTMPEGRRAAVAEAIRRLDADVVALQEVESLAAVEWFRDGQLSGMGYEHAASIDVGHAIGLEQAVLSRVPIVDSRVWVDREIGVHPALYRGRPSKFAGQPMTFRRSPLLVELDVSGGDAGENWSEDDRLTLLVVHLKTGEGSEAWRAAETAALVEIAGELRADRPERRVVMLGDFVGGPGSAHVRTLLEAGFVDVFGGVAGGDGAVPAEYASGIDGGRECLILAGPGTAGLFEGGARCVLGTVVPPGQIRRDLAFGMPGFASDHYPVAADVRVGPAD